MSEDEKDPAAQPPRDRMATPDRTVGGPQPGEAPVGDTGAEEGAAGRGGDTLHPEPGSPAGGYAALTDTPGGEGGVYAEEAGKGTPRKEDKSVDDPNRRRRAA